MSRKKKKQRFPALLRFLALGLRFLRLLLLRCPLARGVDRSRAEHPTVTFSQHMSQLWLSALTAARGRRKLLWPRLTAAPLYGYKSKCIEGYLTMCLFSKSYSGFASLGLWPPLPCAFIDQVYDTRHEFVPVEQAWSSGKIKADGFSHTDHATVAAVGTSCLPAFFFFFN